MQGGIADSEGCHRWACGVKNPQEIRERLEGSPFRLGFALQPLLEGEKCNPRPVSPPSTTELDEEPPPPPPGLSAAEVQSLRDEVHELRAEVTALHTLKMQPLIDEVQGLRTDLEALRAEVGQVAPVMGQVVAP